MEINKIINSNEFETYIKEEHIIKIKIPNHSFLFTEFNFFQSNDLEASIEDHLETENIYSITDGLDEPLLKESLINYYISSVKSYYSKNEQILLKENFSKCELCPSSPNSFISRYHSFTWDL
ncbi:hypothetical protein ACTFIY_000502 [Dictyostelium cf. discoideum]